MRQEKNQPTVRAVERTLNILFLVSAAKEPLGLAQISSETGVDKATALRMLATLESFRLVQRDEVTRAYSIGSGAWQLSSAYQAEIKVVSESHLRELRDATGESVSLVVARGLDRVMLMAIEASHELRVVPQLNSVLPIYSGASGKVFMAFMTPDKRERVIELTGLRPVNERSIVDRETYLQALEAVRQQGFAVSSGDVTFGAAAIAAPILDAKGEVLAVVSLRGPEVRLNPERVRKLAPLVKQTARDIAIEMAGAVRTAEAG